MITVIAEIKVRPGRRDAVLQQINALLPTVRAEQGCGSYVPMIDFNGQVPWRKTVPDSIFMLEEWESLNHLEQHQQQAHMHHHREAIKQDVEEVVIHILDKP